MDDSMEEYVRTRRRIMAEADRRREERVEAARRLLPTLIEDFRRIDPGLRRVVLFGSLARNEVRSAHFDIDLAIDCSPDRFLALVSRALDTPIDIDLVELARAPEYLSRAIDRDGEVLFER